MGREVSRLEKEAAKLAVLEQARTEVEEYEERIASLNDVHTTCGEAWDWNAVANAPPPAPPMPTRDFELTALERLNQYVPTLFERIFGKAEKRRNELATRVVEARTNDENANAAAQRKYLFEHSQWEAQRELAMHILEGDLEAYGEAVGGLNPFDEITEIGCQVEFTFRSQATIDVSVRVDGDEIVPSEVKSLLASGKLSTKKMPKSRFYEIYQDYVCGCALRVAREIFALLPLQNALVTVSARLLNLQVGRQEDAPILSVAISRETLDSLSLEALDPSEAMKNFTHRMGFKRSVGFGGVERLTPFELGWEA
jgi:hypothetical protein